jgi:dTDP-3-amino-3,4,6-trideoxy-alpha-D-glucose transaminase
MGVAGAFSFYPSKNLGCYGDGGGVVCADAGLAERLRMLRNYGQRQRYHHQIKGFNSRLDELQAAILLAKLPGLDVGNQRRREIAAAYADGLRDLPWIVLPAEAPGRHHVRHLYVVRVPDRDRFQRHLAAQGVGTMVHYPVPIHRQEAYAACRDQARFLPVTDAQASRIVSLPIYPELTDAQVAHVIAAVRGCPQS